MGEDVTDRLEHAEILRQLERFREQTETKEKLLFEAVRLLKDNCPNYHWVGIYNLESEDELVLGPFLGKPSPHTRIKVGSGICGAAVEAEETIIVDDVNADPRYLACSIETRSEIVVPIFKEGRIVGEIDIDSHDHAAFSEQDKHFLERVAEILAAAY
jgi:L-methionine (R)-S-oxide reductase